MKRFLYLTAALAIFAAAFCWICSPRANAQSPAKDSAAAAPTNATDTQERLRQYDQLLKEHADQTKRADQMLNDQDTRSKRVESLLVRQEQLMDKQEAAFVRFQKILDTWEQQQKQYQQYLDSLKK
jgi:hypothetical protein